MARANDRTMVEMDEKAVDGKVIEVRDLDVYLKVRDGRLHVVRGISFDLRAGETLVTVGESGCGKSMTARALMRLLPDDVAEVPGSSRILYKGQDLLGRTEREMPGEAAAGA